MSKVLYDYSGLLKIEFKLNPINQIPKSGADLKTIFNLLSIRNVFDILKFIILEIPTIFFCQEKLILSNVVKSFEEILYPFTYPYSVIPILPKTYYKSLEKLNCFIVGINQKYSKDFFEINNINLNDKEYVVVTLTEQEPYYIYNKKNIEKYGILLKTFNKDMQKENTNIITKETNFPKHYQTKLMKNLNQLFYGKNGTQKNINDVENDDIRYQFYYFFASMLQHYKPFLKTDNNLLSKYYAQVESDSIKVNEQLFKIQEFILKDEDSIFFYKYFIETRIWKNFIIKNLYPSTIDEKLEVLLLDENIRRKKNKNMIKQLFKENTPFLSTNKFDITNIELIKITYDLEEEMHISEMNNDLIKYFPLLDENKIESLYNKNFLHSNTKIKNLYKDFYTECQIILKDKKFLEGYSNTGYNINLNEELKSNNENYILKLWYLVICFVFKHLDNGEKWILFNELLKQIQNMVTSYKISIIDQFLSDLMFTTFIKYGDKQMCSLLYKELNDIPCVKEDYLTFTQLHKKFINKKEEFKFTLPKETILKERNYNLFNLPKGNKMTIAFVTACPNPDCQVKVDLKLAILNFSSMNNDNSDKITYKCTICHEFQNAIITISFGNAYNQEYYYQIYTPKYLFYYVKNLGDYNMDNFFEEYTEIFFNLITFFHLRGFNYDFLFPYKERKMVINNQIYNGFNPDTLDVKKAGENKYIYRDPNANKTKWYENIISSENEMKQRRFSKLIPSKKGSLKTFKFEPLSSETFFKNNIKKKDKSSFYSLKYSKTIVEK